MPYQHSRYGQLPTGQARRNIYQTLGQQQPQMHPLFASRQQQFRSQGAQQGFQQQQPQLGQTYGATPVGVGAPVMGRGIGPEGAHSPPGAIQPGVIPEGHVGHSGSTGTPPPPAAPAPPPPTATPPDPTAGQTYYDAWQTGGAGMSGVAPGTQAPAGTVGTTNIQAPNTFWSPENNMYISQEQYWRSANYQAYMAGQPLPFPSVGL